MNTNQLVVEGTVELIDRIYADRFVLDPAGTPRDIFPVTLPQADGKAITGLVKDGKFTRTLEIGMAYGVSTLFILDGVMANGGGTHTAIDPFQATWFESIGPHTVARAGWSEALRLIEAPSCVALPKLLEAGETFDFIFIDGNHRFEYSLVDFFFAEKLLMVGGVVVFHDMWMPSIAKVVAFVGTNRRETFELVIEDRSRVRVLPQIIASAAKSIWRSPLDVNVTRFLTRKYFRNYAAFRKVADMSEVDYAAAWDKYTAF